MWAASYDVPPPQAISTGDKKWLEPLFEEKRLCLVVILLREKGTRQGVPFCIAVGLGLLLLLDGLLLGRLLSSLLLDGLLHGLLFGCSLLLRSSLLGDLFLCGLLLGRCLLLNRLLHGLLGDLLLGSLLRCCFFGDLLFDSFLLCGHVNVLRKITLRMDEQPIRIDPIDPLRCFSRSQQTQNSFRAP